MNQLAVLTASEAWIASSLEIHRKSNKSRGHRSSSYLHVPDQAIQCGELRTAGSTGCVLPRMTAGGSNAVSEIILML